MVGLRYSLFFQRIDQKIEKGADKFRDIGGKVKEFIDYIKA